MSGRLMGNRWAAIYLPSPVYGRGAGGEGVFLASDGNDSVKKER